MRTLAVSLKDIVDKNKNKQTNIRGFNCKTHIIEFKSISNRFLFLVSCNESYSSKTGHIVSIHFDRTPKGKPLSDEVKLHCSCPAFIYWGSAYNSTQKKYNLDFTETRPPDIRDPQRRNDICKHISKVKNDLRGMTYRMLEKKSDVVKAYLNTELPRIGIEETFPSILKFIECNKKDVDGVSFIASINELNYEQKLIELGMINP